MRICLFGASSNVMDAIYYEETEKLGELMAASGLELVFGGGTQGLMGACARGITRGNGYIISVSPFIFNETGILYPDFNELYLTEDLVRRKEVMIRESEGFIIVPGGIGTFDEFFEIYSQKMLGYSDKPIVIFNINGFYDNLIRFIEDGVASRVIAREVLDMITVADTAEAVVAALKG